MFLLNDYNYDLPDDLIAQKPAPQRDRSKLLFLNKETGVLSHHKFYDIYDLLLPTDLLVLNDTRVIPARLFGKKDTGGKAEVFILDYAGGRENPGYNELVLKCLIKASKRPKNGTPLSFGRELRARVVNGQEGIYTVKFSSKNNFENLLDRIGHVPLPPYIKRNDCEDDRTSYQTVYASKKGAVAAPTAGLHFSKKLLKKIEKKGIKIVTVTLHVGYGTFLPVRVSDIRDHKIHSEWYSISKETADIINHAKTKGRRIIAVGTTCVRTLEYASDVKGNVAHGSGTCDLFIYPGYRFKVVDAMITNFHLPKSTLLMLVSAFAGRENILNAYQTAIDKKYRLFSYGDAMFIA
ncbi:MAG: tRNA preQ1(34) S-adenosylmethionine ribosyltransferase-isomerase QueA [Deltaproteobacteria bacterium]|nr:tRNA preQ1(34) S-adenosylmethionine ribosyltransferase-isomerase QueA [Deltaproteobacteria bacterium]MBW2014528.1 tRNA preQ1(34) S-adenosylmethionine ribosyltransferase-isomerase QueA [Deltaproteobacteria bacterium]MBW2088293.1 tRNA preQ1(34) S-adenosylmethionine ribosyltransferase-isomerase QueA [Deltaproteobacteria bacterium]MBW2321592.1 tRNA preQ1(34) S-adenosylmethionine ribosyltransferase-isomerase QueA [Deltaproteobacteria bacterium]